MDELSSLQPRAPGRAVSDDDSQFEVRDVREPGHFWIENEVYTEFAAEMGVHAFAVYAALCSYANAEGQAWPAISTIAVKLDLSANTIRKSIKMLVKIGLIKRKQRVDAVGDPMSSLFTLMSVKRLLLQRQEKARGTSRGEVPHAVKGVPHGVKYPAAPDTDSLVLQSQANDGGTSRGEVPHAVKGGTSRREGGTSRGEGGVLHGVKGGTSRREGEQDLMNNTQLNKTNGSGGSRARAETATADRKQHDYADLTEERKKELREFVASGGKTNPWKK